MLTRYSLILLLSLPAFAQVDFSILPSTKPFTMGPSPPTVCQQGQMFFSTTAPSGANVFSCGANNDWTAVGTGTPAVLSAVAVSGNYNDLVNKPATLTVPTKTSELTNDSGFLTPLSNAPSATKLATTPTVCLSGLYATGISAFGNASCAQVQYSQIAGKPTAYALPQATTVTLGGVMPGTGLSATLGVLSVKYGILSGTAAQGNDSRIVGALQRSTGLADLHLTGTSPASINSSTTGNAATATRAQTAGSLLGTGTLRMKGTCGAGLTLLGGEVGLNVDTDCNFHLHDQLNLNRSVMIYTWKNGVEQKCDQSNGFSAFTDFSASGVPVCTVAPKPPALPSGVTASGSACTITAITNGVITGATCAP